MITLAAPPALAQPPPANTEEPAPAPSPPAPYPGQPVSPAPPPTQWQPYGGQPPAHGPGALPQTSPPYGAAPYPQPQPYPYPYGNGYPPPRPQPQPPPPPETDPLLPTGIALGALGAAGIVIGAVVNAEGYGGGDEHCGLSGCFHRHDNDMKIGGMSMVVGSTALTAFSIPLIIAGATGDPPVRHDDDMMSAGVVLTGLGLTAAAAGIGAIAAEEHSVQEYQRTEVASVAIPLLIGGAVSLGAGIPLWAVGAQDWEPPKYRDPDQPLQPGEEALPLGTYVERSPEMKITGMVLTGLGVAAAGVGIGLFVEAENARDECRDADKGCDFTGVGETIGGVASLGAAGLNLLVGIPLWAVGASETLVGPDEARAATTHQKRVATAAPDIAIGPGSLKLDWRF